MNPTRLVRAPRAVVGREVMDDVWVTLAGARIVGVGTGGPPALAGPDVVSEAVTGTLTPGFVDVHCHGGGGAAFTDGAAGAETAIAAHLAHGTTSVVASLVTDHIDTLAEEVEALAPLVRDGRLLGVHLEGPWLSPAHRGAHDPQLLRSPTPAALDALLNTGVIAMVTLAPELPGGMQAVERIVAAGAIAAIGHTDATFTQTREALSRGATQATHLFNAMRSLHHREPGPVVALLRSNAWIEVIADGIHLHPEMVSWIAREVGERLVLVTDAMAAAAAADGLYDLGPLRVQVRERVATVIETGAIAGSTLTLDAAVRFAVNEAGVPLGEAVAAATMNPAAALRVTDRGLLAPGRRADLVALDDDLYPTRVMRAGQWIPRS